MVHLIPGLRSRQTSPWPARNRVAPGCGNTTTNLPEMPWWTSLLRNSVGTVAGQGGGEIVCPAVKRRILDEFAKRFDGFSIGSNDLTQLTLGVDRDSEIVAFDYDERDEGVKEMIRLAVEGCRRNGIHSGLCGQAPSDYPDMAEFLVRIGIDSISLNPDVVVKTTRQILQLEQQLVPMQ
jgi:phosphoenolpyruvate-protein kinase (PTS system EI component)